MELSYEDVFATLNSPNYLASVPRVSSTLSFLTDNLVHERSRHLCEHTTNRDCTRSATEAVLDARWHPRRRRCVHSHGEGDEGRVFELDIWASLESIQGKYSNKTNWHFDCFSSSIAPSVKRSSLLGATEWGRSWSAIKRDGSRSTQSWPWQRKNTSGDTTSSWTLTLKRRKWHPSKARCSQPERVEALWRRLLSQRKVSSHLTQL